MSASTTVWDGRITGMHGIARFAREVYSRLPAQPDAWTDARTSPYSAFAPVETAVMLRRRRADLFLSPTYAPALRGPYQQLITVHDLIFLDVDAESSLAKRQYFERLVRPTIRRANAVMTVSEFSRKRLVEWSGLAEDRVFMVGNGCSEAPLDDVAGALTDRARDPFVLFVGNERVHKNFRLVARAMKHVEAGVRLVTVGLSQEYLDQTCSETGLDRARVTGHVGIDDAKLTELYTAASVLAVPSTYEGFGLIALEALARGVMSVYCCDAVDEVVGSTGVRSADADDEVAYADALTRAMASPTPVSELLARADSFRWTDVARRVDAARRDVLEA
ncbi:glycosyltransferase family 4 protein [Sanguibacter massiliensis]|uniref:glycosyltransferase family 4 protein n=1 Tax=Sanguibacter massiliensis TaxID=1973217 RepID=UPI000C83D84A|nr:glycosyltransferase family 1 protein [Sanguibacter massiliensis]